MGSSLNWLTLSAFSCCFVLSASAGFPVVETINGGYGGDEGLHDAGISYSNRPAGDLGGSGGGGTVNVEINVRADAEGGGEGGGGNRDSRGTVAGGVGNAISGSGNNGGGRRTTRVQGRIYALNQPPGGTGYDGFTGNGGGGNVIKIIALGGSGGGRIRDEGTFLGDERYRGSVYADGGVGTYGGVQTYGGNGYTTSGDGRTKSGGKVPVIHVNLANTGGGGTTGGSREVLYSRDYVTGNRREVINNGRGSNENVPVIRISLGNLGGGGGRGGGRGGGQVVYGGSRATTYGGGGGVRVVNGGSRAITYGGGGSVYGGGGYGVGGGGGGDKVVIYTNGHGSNKY